MPSTSPSCLKNAKQLFALYRLFTGRLKLSPPQVIALTKNFHGLSQYISLKQMRNASFPWPSPLELLIGIVVES